MVSMLARRRPLLRALAAAALSVVAAGVWARAGTVSAKPPPAAAAVFEAPPAPPPSESRSAAVGEADAPGEARRGAPADARRFDVLYGFRLFNDEDRDEGTAP